MNDPLTPLEETARQLYVHNEIDIPTAFLRATEFHDNLAVRRRQSNATAYQEARTITDLKAEIARLKEALNPTPPEDPQWP